MRMWRAEDSQAPTADWTQALMSATVKANDCFRPPRCPADLNLRPADLNLRPADLNLRPADLNHLGQCPVLMARHPAPTPCLPHFGYFLVKYLAPIDPLSTDLALTQHLPVSLRPACLRLPRHPTRQNPRREHHCLHRHPRPVLPQFPALLRSRRRQRHCSEPSGGPDHQRRCPAHAPPVAGRARSTAPTAPTPRPQ
jgi:hypothetical protein